MPGVQFILAIVFWLSAACVVYAYAEYPVVIWMLSRAFGRLPVPPTPAGESPKVSLLIAAHNEEAVIDERIANALSMDYPNDRFEIVVASDGSSDRTSEIVSSYSDRGVRVLDYRPRQGKSSVLNAAMQELAGDIVVMSDANTLFDTNAIRDLTRWFADAEVGAVCGRLILKDSATGKNADGAYWKYETFLKKCESRLGALLGTNGAIYAIRRAQYVPIPVETIVDDFVIPLLARMKHGCRIIYDCDAVAREESAQTVGAEFHRRARIGAGGAQATAMLWPLLDPRQGWIAFTFFSHKVLRWICPLALIAMLVSSALLEQQLLYRWLLIAQLAFYGVSALTMLLPIELKLARPLRLASMFTGMNLALLIGFWRWVRGGQSAAWKRTERSAEVRGVAA
ncbi:MAG TPA: glycosyltransferase family 2 protein [Tepidisphaeraceae bacterium]|nr:glycosyltransferase family 2 protein [Tepidisphaeraceae bacterium]